MNQQPRAVGARDRQRVDAIALLAMAPVGGNEAIIAIACFFLLRVPVRTVRTVRTTYGTGIWYATDQLNSS